MVVNMLSADRYNGCNRASKFIPLELHTTWRDVSPANVILFEFELAKIATSHKKLLEAFSRHVGKIFTILQKVPSKRRVDVPRSGNLRKRKSLPQYQVSLVGC